MDRGPLNVIGARVRKLRLQQGLSQAQLTAKCQIAGLNITRSALARIEARERGVADFEAQLLSLVLKVKISDLFPMRAERLQRRHANPEGRPVKQT